MPHPGHAGYPADDQVAQNGRIGSPVRRDLVYRALQMRSSDAASDANDAPRLRAIIADDDPFARRMIKDALQRSEIVVIAEATNGREAVELCLHYRPEVLLMDV